jgi:hypothetical protein
LRRARSSTHLAAVTAPQENKGGGLGWARRVGRG